MKIHSDSPTEIHSIGFTSHDYYASSLPDVRQFHRVPRVHSETATRDHEVETPAHTRAEGKLCMENSIQLCLQWLLPLLLQQYNTALYILSRRARTYDPQVPEPVSRDKIYKLQTTCTNRPSLALHFHYKCPFKLTPPARCRYKPIQLQILNLTTIRIVWSVYFFGALSLCPVQHW